MKRFLIPLLLLSLGLTACGETSAPPDLPPVEETVPQAPETPEEQLPPEPDFASQLTLLADQAGLWNLSQDAEWWAYAVSDLDQNGRLEVITTTTQGTGHFTTTLVYEVSEDLRTLVPCPADELCPPAIEILGDGSGGYLPFPVYLDAEDGTYHYVFHSTVKESAFSYWEAIRAITLRGGQLSGAYLGHQNTLYEIDPNTSEVLESVFYYGPGGKTSVNEKDYTEADIHHFSGDTPLRVQFSWQEISSPEDFSQEMLPDRLSASWEGFALTPAN